MQKLISRLVCASISLMALAGPSNANSLTVLHAFAGADGADPDGALIQASDGNFYGTTPFGGSTYVAGSSVGKGALYKMTPTGTVNVLHSFGTLGATFNIDGTNPFSPVIQGQDGRLYGTAQNDGASGFGTVYAIGTNGSGFTALHAFVDGGGSFPYGGLVQATDGTIFGTTVGATTPEIDSTIGTVFNMRPDGTNFNSHDFTETDGSSPVGGLIQGLDGSIYGSTFDESTFNGLLFKTDVNLSPTSLYTFNGTDGANPRAALFQASDGNFYATTTAGGTHGVGTVVKVTPAGALVWATSFPAAYGDQPFAPLIQASDGNLYGTTSIDGTNGTGTIYQITPAGVLKKIHDFNTATDGGHSHAGLLLAKDGYLYGTTSGGGANNFGTIFRFSLDPIASSLSPSTTSSGSPAFTLTVTGANFNAQSTVLWNGSALTTTYVSPTTLTASVPAANIAAPGSAAVTVRNRDGGTSGTLTFTVQTGTTLTALLPDHLTKGHTAFALRVFGAGFKAGDTVNWNGSPRATTFVSAGQLSAAIPAADLNTVATRPITVTTVAGTITKALPFTILPTPTLTTISPNQFALLPDNDAALTPNVTMTLTGTNFVSGDSVRWNGQLLPTVFVSATQLTATIPSFRLVSAYPVLVTVGSPDGVVSNGLPFRLFDPPYLVALYPAHVPAGNPDLVLNVDGESFGASTFITFGTTVLPTTFVNGNRITAVVPAALLKHKGAATVTVTIPGNGSATLPFTIDFTHTFTTGLQMVSVPMDYSGIALNSILDVANVKLAAWNPATVAYVLYPNAPADTFRQGRGVWARFTQSTSIIQGGTDLTAGTGTISVPLTGGWNMIGNPYASALPLSTVRILDTAGHSLTLAQASANALIYPVLFSYEGSGYQAHTNDSLQPYHGYWIQAFGTCTLQMPAPPTANVRRNATTR